MRAVIQRVSKAAVTIDKKIHGEISQGLLILLGIEPADTREDADWLIKKIVNLRIFNDADGVMNRSLTDVSGQLLVVSQFTLFASCKKGNRPSYIRAAGHHIAVPLYDYFIGQAATLSRQPVATGVFGADMQVALLNDGPVTICIDTKNRE
ncbi:MAG: D-tyrosyl-tRNA(Tyr) deacylase [Alloprevotella sp.]|nr:D-tyrosyl-tRNA(Tyr) deacylase [Alloprevotella sp.]